MLACNQVCKAFSIGGSGRRPALVNLDLRLGEGEFVTIIGSNGAGKSTLLNAISGVYPLDDGSIQIAGHDVTRLPEHRRAGTIGRVFQDPLKGTAAGMTIEENLAMALKRGSRRSLTWGISSKKREFFRERLALLDLGLEDRLHQDVGLLSGGQRQALTLLMATITRPELLLLDEHTAALDPKTAQKILELTEKIVRDQNLTVLMVTHNMEQALGMGDRTIMMHHGEIILDVSDPERQHLGVSDLLQRFAEVRGERLAEDRLLLA